MSIYTKHYENPYPDGYQDRPSEETPVTADILNMESQTLEAIEAYLEDNPIPSKTSDLTNDSGFITNLVSNLVNYYNKAAIDNLIASVSGNLNIEVVEALPTTGISTKTFYLVPKSSSEEQNLYDEYINTNGTTSGWERLGDVSTDVDMSDYYDKNEIDDIVQELNEAIANKVDKDDTVKTNFTLTESENYTIIRQDCYKIGKRCVISFEAVATKDIQNATGVPVAVIPVEYRPSKNIEGIGIINKFEIKNNSVVNLNSRMCLCKIFNDRSSIGEMITLLILNETYITMYLEYYL